MNDRLEMPEVRARISKVSVEDYHAMIEAGRFAKKPVELIRGLIVEKMSKSPLHRLLGTRLYRLVIACVGDELYCLKEDPLTFIDSEPEPDVAVIRGDEAAFVREHPPTAALVVEVAVSSASLDRANAALYAENGVEEYWIVLAAKRQVEVWSEPRDGRYQSERIASVPETLSCGSVPAIRVVLADLFASV